MIGTFKLGMSNLLLLVICIKQFLIGFRYIFKDEELLTSKPRQLVILTQNSKPKMRKVV